MDFGGIKNNIKPPTSLGGMQSQQNSGNQNQQQNQFGQQNQQQNQFEQQNQQQNQQQSQQPNQQQNQFGQQSQQPNQQQNQFGQQNQQQNQFGQQNQQQNQQMRPQATGVSLKKGQKVSLTKMNNALDNILVGLGWDISQNSNIACDLDVEVFMLGQNGKILGDEWFVFYNKLVSPDGSVKHSGDNKTGMGAGDDEVISVQLSRVNPQVARMIFVVTINEAMERNHNFGQISNAYIRIVDQISGQELVRYNLTEYYNNVISMMVGEVYKHNNEWKFNPIGDGTADDLMGLCTRYGVNIQ
ncbi:MAG: TerD family protein [Clostridiales bacterium]